MRIPGQRAAALLHAVRGADQRHASARLRRCRRGGAAPLKPTRFEASPGEAAPSEASPGQASTGGTSPGGTSPGGTSPGGTGTVRPAPARRPRSSPAPPGAQRELRGRRASPASRTPARSSPPRWAWPRPTPETSRPAARLRPGPLRPGPLPPAESSLRGGDPGRPRSGSGWRRSGRRRSGWRRSARCGSGWRRSARRGSGQREPGQREPGRRRSEPSPGDPGRGRRGPGDPGPGPRGRGRLDEPGADEPGADEPAPGPGDSPAGPQNAPAPAAAGDGEPLKLVRIGVEAVPEPYPEDPWLPGSGRPDRRVLVIGVVVIAGLLAVASTAWLVGTNQPQAGPAHSSHQSRPAPLGSGHAQPSQALSGHPAPSLSPASQPAPARTGTAPPRTGRSGAGRNAPGHSNGSHRHGHTGTGHTGTGHSNWSAAAQPGRTSRRAASRIRARPGTPAATGSGPSRSGPPGTVRNTTPPVPQPHQPAPASRGGGQTRHLPRHRLDRAGAGRAGGRPAGRRAPEPLLRGRQPPRIPGVRTPVRPAAAADPA